MPYIQQNRRTSLDHTHLDVLTPRTSGELNYVITRVINNYTRKHKTTYASLNDVLGALEGAKLEFARRIVTPYEDNKIKENGDVYDPNRIPCQSNGNSTRTRLYSWASNVGSWISRRIRRGC